jgi:hypothetical protein
VGCNFTPSSAGNQLEMWQAETFDPTTIQRELGWASSLGMNAIRVYLHDLLHAADGEAFLDRVETVLSMAEFHGIGVIPVLFDGVWNPNPVLGPQPEPQARVHNSIWVQSPGRAVLYDPGRWSGLHPYVSSVLGRFGEDRRILAWDLFNEPDQMDVDTLSAGSRDEKSRLATDLLDMIFDWARHAGPSQPVTVGIWEYDSEARPQKHRLNELILERSDIISFHCYEPKEKLCAVIDHLSEFGRPLLCTEWLARTAGSTVDLLEVFFDRGVGALNWGLVDGRTQTRFPWRSWWELVDEDEPWFHELLLTDGTPYDVTEIELFRRVTRASARRH